MTADYELAEHGADLALSVRGPDPEACLRAALRGFAAHVAEVPSDRPQTPHPVELRGKPAAWLVDALDEAIALLDIEGALACGLVGVEIGRDGLRGFLVTVSIAGLSLRGAPPKAATWHTARLEPTDEGWEGRVVLDL